MVKENSRFNEFTIRGKQGTPADVDFLMEALLSDNTFATTKLVDYALGLVETQEGITHLKYYLFRGTQKQRNYAALYFKRRRDIFILYRAVALGAVDMGQAFSK